MNATLIDTATDQLIRHSGRVANDAGFASAVRAGQCAQRIAEGYLKFDSAFRLLTERAAERFAERDWQGSQHDALDRADLFERSVDTTVAGTRTHFSDFMYQPAQWQAVKRNFASLIGDLADCEFCKAFFNATTQRLFRSIGVPQHLEFADGEAVMAARETGALRRLTVADSLQATCQAMLHALPIEAAWRDLTASAIQAAEMMQKRLQQLNLTPISIEWLDTAFYRFTRAYVIGRIHTTGASLPFAVALTNSEEGAVIDAVMLHECELTALFGCARASFHAELEQITQALGYLQTFAPGMSRSELIAMLGWPTKLRAVN